MNKKENEENKTNKRKPNIEDILKKQDERELKSFGSRDLIVSSESKEAAGRDVKMLEIPPRYKRAILTGYMKKPKEGEITYDRDHVHRTALQISCALIRASYRYETIFHIFFNRHLTCGFWFIDKGEEDLKKDVLEAFKIVRIEYLCDDEKKRSIKAIKGTPKINAEEKLRRISLFIEDDLFGDRDPAGKGFYNKDRLIFYFFDEEDKLLMDIDGIDFYCYVRNRFGIPDKDFKEIKETIRTHIWDSKKSIEAHMFAYFDKNKYVLYVSDHDNGIYRLDGKKIEHVDNGTDRIYFEFNSDFIPFEIELENLKATNYFEREIPEGKAILKNGMEIKLPRKKGLGLDYSRFDRENSLLCRYLLDITSFAETEKNLTVTDQQFLLLVYFYSLFFESLVTEKPIICFVGLKDSGKSTICALMGKILFGDKFQCRHFPEDIRDLKTIIGENYFMVFDNVDHYVDAERMNALCVAATGGTIEKRKLYTDRDIVKIRPNIFLGITTRMAKFKRDDLISRLILFNTQKITERIQKEKFYRDIEENRNKIMEEVLVNLNPIITLLKRQKDYSPTCTFRVADWETFGRKICLGFPWGLYFKLIMDVMNEEKDKFALEDDPLCILLEDIVIAGGEYIEDLSSSELYIKLEKRAETLKMKDFTKRYKSPRSMGMRIRNVEDELGRIFEVEIRPVRANVKLYSFSPLEGLTEKEPEKEDAREKVSKIRAKYQPPSENEEEEKE